MTESKGRRGELIGDSTIHSSVVVYDNKTKVVTHTDKSMLETNTDVKVLLSRLVVVG